MSRYISRLAAGYTGLIGCLVLIGWQLNIPLLRGELPGNPVPMRMSTALCFLLCSVSLFSLQLRRTPRWFFQVAQGGVGLTIAIALYMLSRRLSGWNVGLDGWFEPKTLSEALPYFGQMCSLTALVFLLVGVALLLLITRTQGGIWLAQGLSCVVLFLEIATLVGYIFQARVFYELVHGSIVSAPLTAISFLVLSVGLLCVYPKQGIMQTVTSAAIGGILIRRLLPWAIAVPIALNWLLCNVGSDRGEDVTFHCMIECIAEIGFFSAVIWWLARSLNRVDARRHQAEQELQQINQALEQQVEVQTAELAQSQQRYQTLVNSVNGVVWEADPQTLQFTFVSQQAERVLGYPIADWYEPGFWVNHVHPDDREDAIAFCRTTTQLKQDHQFEYRMIVANGESVWLHDIVRVEVKDDQVVKLVGLLIDISERKRIEAEYERTQAALNQSEEHLRLATDLNQIGCWNFEVATGKATWNDSHFRLMGLEPGGAASHYLTWRDRIHPADLKFAEQAFSRALETHTDLEVEYRYLLPDGTIRWILDRASGVYDQTGKPVRMLGITLDISERKRAEAERKQAEIALAEREAELRAVFEQVAVGVDYTTLDGQYLAVNQAYCDMLGYSKEELLDKTFVELTHPDDIEVDLALSQQLIAGEIPAYSMEKRYRRKDGSYLWAGLTVSPIKDANGELNRLLAVIQDISERKRIESDRKAAEAALQDSQERLNLTLQAVKLGFWELDLTTGTLMVSNQCKANFGLPPEADFTFQQFPEFIHPDDRARVQSAIQAAIATGADYHIEYQIVWLDGGIHWIMGHGRTNYGTDGTPLSMNGITLDITERKQAEIALQHSESKFRVLVESLPDLIMRMNGQGVYLDFFSTGAFQVLGNRDQVGQTLYEAGNLPLDLAEVRMGYIQQALQTGEMQVYEQQILIEGELRIEEVRIAISGDNEVVVIVRDMTERKRAEEALAESEAKFRSLVENANDIIYARTPDGTFTYLSPQTMPILGYAPSELVGQTAWSLIHPDDLAIIQTNAQRGIETGQSQTSQEVRVQRKDGSWCWMTIGLSLIWNADGQVISIQGIARDVSDRKQAEIALAASEAKFRSLVENANDIIYTRDLDGTLTYISPQITPILGYDVSELLDQQIWLVIHPDDRAIAQTNVQRAIATGQIQMGQEIRVQRKDGDWCWMTVNFSLIRDADGQVTGLQGIARDISIRRRMEAALAESEVKYRSLVENASDVIYTRDLDGRFTYISPQVVPMLGYEPSELLEQQIWLVIHSDDLAIAERFTQQVLETGRSQTDREIRVRHKDGSWRWVMANLVMIRDANGQAIGIQGSVQDVSERKRLEAERKAVEEALWESRELLRRILDSVPQMIFWKDRNSVYLGCNQHFVHATGFRSADDVVGKTDYDLLCTRQEAAYYQDSDRRVMDSNMPLLRILESYQRDGDQQIWIETNKVPLHDAAGDVIGVLGTSEDITERKRIEAALRNSEALLKQAQRLGKVGGWEVDWKTGKMDWTEQMYDIFELPLHTATYFNPNDLETSLSYYANFYSPETWKILKTAILNCLNKGEFYELELPFITAKGNHRWVQSTGASVWEAGQVVRFFGSFIDITEHKQAELAVQYQAQQEQALNRVIQTIRNSLELETIFSTAVQEGTQLVGVSGVYVLQYQSSSDYWVFSAGYSSDRTAPSMIGYQIPNANNPIGEQLRRFELVQVDDTTQLDESDSINQTVAQNFPGSWLAVPLIVNGDAWGCLAFVQYPPIPFQDEQVVMSRRLADQLAIAIQQSILYQQLQQLNTTLDQQVQDRTAQLRQALDFEAILKRITDAVRDSLDENRILQTAVEEVAQRAGVYLCNIVMYDNGKSPEELNPDTFTVKGEYTSIPDLSGSLLNPDDFSTVYDQLLRGITTQFCTLLPQWTDSWVTILLSPIMDEQGAIGDLLLLRDNQDTFSKSEIRLVEQVANQCAIALRQSQLYQAAQAQVMELERLNHLKDDFLSTVSHELRTPMSNIKMATQMLEITLSRLDILDTQTTVSRYFKILKEEGQREVNLINNLLDLSRLDADTEPLSLTTITLQDWLPHLTDPFIDRIQRQHQQLQLEISENLPALTTDLVYLERVLSELLNNACKYTPAGETITVSANLVEEGMETEELKIENAPLSSFSILHSSLSSSFQIAVRNTGVEIPSSECDRIFEKFYRIPKNDPWKHGGTGLGLALARKFIEKLGGTIGVVSRQGQTSFVIQLPLHLDEVDGW